MVEPCMSCKVLVVGEAWGAKEAEAKRAFVGPSGGLLRSGLIQAGIPLSLVEFTNVLNLQPRPTNDIKNCCGPRSEGIPGLPPLAPGHYLRKEYADEIERLQNEITRYNPNLIIPLGNTPTTVLTGQPSKITQNRGTITLSPNCRRTDGSYIKLLPTYHPAAILRDMTMRPVFIYDLMKAARHYDTPEYTRPARQLWIKPTLSDIQHFYTKYILPARDKPWGVDIETKSGTITEIGFALPHIGIVIPFYTRLESHGNYWHNVADERRAWEWVRQIAATLTQPVFQNGLYDLNYLWRTVGITFPHSRGDDTMLKAHSQQPEMKKGLGFLASLYTDEPSWKFMRKGNTDTTKREDD
jgi:DNA polymerase